MSDVTFYGSTERWITVNIGGRYAGDLARILSSEEWVYQHEGIAFLRLPQLRAIADKLDELNTQSQTAKE